MPLWLACHSLYRSGWPRRSADLCLANHHSSWQDSASWQLPLSTCATCLQHSEEGAGWLRAIEMLKTEPRSSERATSPVIHRSNSPGPAFSISWQEEIVWPSLPTCLKFERSHKKMSECSKCAIKRGRTQRQESKLHQSEQQNKALLNYNPMPKTNTCKSILI